MTPVNLLINLVHNNRTLVGADKERADFLANDSSNLTVRLHNADLGRLDSEGIQYIAEVLDILPGDLVSWVLEEAY